ncbi:efflux RND transporter periplasmic adaptor subunit [Candidatus Riflebacteria bacterium]
MEKLKKYQLFIIIPVFIGVGFFLGRSASPPGHDMHQHKIEKAGSRAKAKFYTCSMHPSVRLPDPNAKCPLCGMDLIPVEDEGGDGDPNIPGLKLSEKGRSLASIETARVERKNVAMLLSLFGRIDYDENRLAYITARVKGRLEKLYVNFSGVEVKKGEHLFELYSPEIFTAQAELINARKGSQEQGVSSALHQSHSDLLEAARTRLKYWGLSDAQIKEIENSGKPSFTITITSPFDGTVVENKAREGLYVKEGSIVYKIADLSRLWVHFEAYESDIAWLQVGQKISFKTPSFPGEKFKGKITFIQPVLNPKTRTIMLRVNVENSDYRLKPEMFVRGQVEIKLNEHGLLRDEKLDRSFICPMHPEIIKEKIATCDICKMSLIPFPEFSKRAKSSKKGLKPLVIPATAPLLTGKRAVVYVEKDKGRFEGREVELGPRLGDYYLVKSGLKEGEKVVFKGNFKIDSALQILAKKSMMSIKAFAADAPDTPQSFIAQMKLLFKVYFSLQRSLAGDDYAKAKKILQQLSHSLEKVDDSLLSGEILKKWVRHREKLQKHLSHIKHMHDIAAVRKIFDGISQVFISLQKDFNYQADSFNVAFCPMAFANKGAKWLQKEKGIANPYYGAAMLRCGEIVTSIKGKSEKESFVSPEKSSSQHKHHKNSQMSAATPGLFPDPFYQDYFALQKTLAAEKWDKVPGILEKAKHSIEKFIASLDSSPLIEKGRKTGKKIKKIISRSIGNDDPELLRIQFSKLSEQAIKLQKDFPQSKGKFFIIHCSMAFDGEGASWLQDNAKVANPYYGPKMLRCGAVKKTLQPGSK